MGRARQQQQGIAVAGHRGADSSRSALRRDWGALGFKTGNELTDAELAIADLDLRRSNQWVDGINSNPPRPYTNLFAYRPHMEGNKRHWLSVELRFEHADRRIYSIAEVRSPARFLGPSSVSAVRVEDYGTDLDKAIDGAQALADSMVEHFFETSAGSRARLASYPFPGTVRTGAGGQLCEPTDNAFVNARQYAVAQLARGIEAADEQDEWQQNKEAQLQAVVDRGYVASLSSSR